jgi:UDP-N-acetylmuramoyl-tripeptide--D-alanyl-D-alanine ligase
MTTLEKIYQLFLSNPIVITDSRSVQEGSIFFALKGENFDGNKFALQAINQGCAAAIVDDPNIIHDKCIQVSNVLETLQNLANIHRKALDVKVIAITGSNGKTTTKELVNCVLSQKYKVYATKGNLNNHIGVPLTLLSLTKEIDIAVVEMGANHPGEIGVLAKIAEPNFGIITNIGIAHLEGFGSFEGVKQTKGELYHFISQNNGTVFYNPVNEHLKDLIAEFNLSNQSISYGYGFSDVCIDDVNANFYLTLKVKTAENSSYDKINTALVGNYNFENVLASITIGNYLEVPFDLMKVALDNYVPSNSRSQLVKTNLNTVILDAYNANPSSMEVAIRNFATLQSSNKVIIVGEMLELGDYSTLEHKKISDLIKSFEFAKIIFIGKGFESFSKDCLFFDSSGACSNYLKENPITNAHILLKGSRGVKLEMVMEKL